MEIVNGRENEMNLNEIIEKLKSAKTTDDFICPYVETGKSLVAHIEEFIQTDTAKQFAFEMQIRAVRAERELEELKHDNEELLKSLTAELDKKVKPYCWVIPKFQQGTFYKEKPKGMATIPLYTAPTTKPLSDEEIQEVYAKCPVDFDVHIVEIVRFARAIEARLGIK